MTKRKPHAHDDWIQGLVAGLEELRDRGECDALLLDACLALLARLGEIVPPPFKSYEAMTMAAFEGDQFAAGTREMLYDRFIPTIALVIAYTSALPGCPFWNQARDRFYEA